MPVEVTKYVVNMYKLHNTKCQSNTRDRISPPPIQEVARVTLGRLWGSHEGIKFFFPLRELPRDVFQGQ